MFVQGTVSRCESSSNKKWRRFWSRKQVSRTSKRSLLQVGTRRIITQLLMYCGSGTGGRCCICAGQTLRMHSPDWWQHSAFLREITSWPPSWKCDVSKIWHVHRCVFTWRTILQNFISIRFEMTELRGCLNSRRWVAIWDQFLIQKII